MSSNGTRPGSAIEVADYRGRQSRGERHEETLNGDVAHGSVLVAVAGEDGGARVVPVRDVAVLVLLALGVLDKAHVGRDPAATRLHVPDVVVLERERPCETSLQLRESLGRDEAGQGLDLPHLDRAVGCGDDDDLSGGLDALEPGALAGAVDGAEGLEEEPVGDEPGVPTQARAAEDLADLGVAIGVDPGQGGARIARVEGKAAIGDCRAVFGVAVRKEPRGQRTMRPMAAIAAAARVWTSSRSPSSMSARSSGMPPQ